MVDEKYAPGSKDYSSMITKAKSAGAEVVLALPSPPDGMAMMKQMKELGFNAKAYIFVRAPDAGSWGTDLGSTGEYVVGPGYVFSDLFKYPGAKELGEKFKAKFNRPADAMVGPSYATIQILADAISRADKYDRDSIRDALTKSKMMTVQGSIAMRPDGTADVEFNAYQWLGGQQVLVWPPSQATKPFVFPAPAWDKR